MNAGKNKNSPFTVHEWANIHSIASSHFRTSSLHGIRKELGARVSDATADGSSDTLPQLAMAREVSPESGTQESEPTLRADGDVKRKHADYQFLFAEVEATGQVDHDSSILCPAAYFVDLMRLVEKEITNGTQNKWDGLAGLTLLERRPDLWEIDLDAKNTTTEVPYLEIVNDVLRAHLPGVAGSVEAGLTQEQREQKQRERKHAARLLLATAHYPFDLPVHMPLLQIRLCLANFGVKLTDIYETFGLAQENTGWVAEALGLSSTDEFTRLTTPDRKVESLLDAYGFPKANELGQVQSVELFLTHTALKPAELHELLQLDIPPWWWEGPQRKLVQIEFFMFQNILDDHYERPDYLNRFIRLRKRLDWSFSDLHWALRSIGVDLAKHDGKDPEAASKVAMVNKHSLPKLAQIKRFSGKYKLAVDVVCSFVHDMNTTPGFAAPNKPAPKSLFDRVFNTPPFYQGKGAGGGDYQPWEAEEQPWTSTGVGPEEAKRNQGVRASLLAALNVGNDDLQAIVDHCCKDDLIDEQHRLDPTGIRLDVATLTRLYRFSKMASVLGLRVKEYLVLLQCITGKGPHRLAVPEVASLDDLGALDHWIEWLKEARLSPYQLEYLTTGKLSDEARGCFDPGWTDDGLRQFTRGLRETLEPRLIKAHAFAQGTIKPEESAAAVIALHEAGLINGAGLVRCPVSAASAAPGEFPRLTQSQVREALESFAARKSQGKLTGAGKTQGDVIAIAASSDRQTVFAATAHGVSCFRRQADGWMQSTSDAPAPSAVRALAVTPDGQTAFAATNQQLYRSRNRGEKWEDLEVEGFDGPYLLALAVSPDGKTLYAGTDGGLYCWRDGGKTWDHIAREKLQPDTYEDVTAVAVGLDGRSLIAAIRVMDKGASNHVKSNGVFRSADVGKTWEKSGVSVDKDVIIDSLTVNSRGEIRCANKANGVFDGSGWSGLSISGNEPIAVTAIVLDADGASVIAAGGNGELWRCFDILGANPARALDTLQNNNKNATEEITDTLNRELDFQMQSAIQQLAATLNQDWHLVANTFDFLNPRERGAGKILTDDGLQDAALLLYLPKALGLSAEGFAAILKHASLFHLDASRSKIRLNVDMLRSVHAFAELVEAFEKQGSSRKETAPLLADLALRWSFTAQLTDADIQLLKSLGGWQEDQSSALHLHLKAMATPGGVVGLSTMKRGFDLASKLGVDVQTLTQLCKLHEPQTSFDEFSAAAHGLLGVVKSKYSHDEWEKIFGPIRNHLNERERDALVGYLMHKRGRDEVVAKHFDSMKTLQDLSDYLLIDVEMSGVATVSKIKQGLNTLQRYIQRCHMGLEGEGAVTFPIGDKEWAWRSHYRLWEANRKVFLYPENYLDPGLRKIKTPLYKELEDELLQGEITDEAVSAVYTRYFDKLEELSQLILVDSCAAEVRVPGSSEGHATRFYIARTQADPPTFYFRSAVVNSAGGVRLWRPWQEIHLSIQSDSVSSLYADDRLHLFWVEERETTEQNQSATKKTTTKATGKFSYHNISGTWCPPQVIPAFNDVAVHGTVAEDDKKPVLDPKIVIPDKSFRFPLARGVTSLSLARDWKNVGKVKRQEGWALSISPDGGTLYVGAGNSGSIHRYSLSDDNWETRKQGVNEEFKVDSIRSFTWSPCGRYLFSGSWGGIVGKKGVYRLDTHDDHAEWQPKVEGLAGDSTNKEHYQNVLAFTWDRVNGQLMVSTQAGVFVSADLGESWNPIPMWKGNAYGTQLDYPICFTWSFSGDVLWAGTHTGRVFTKRSTSSAWTQVHDFSTAMGMGVTSMLARGETLLLCAARTKGVYRWSESGSKWELKNKELAPYLDSTGAVTFVAHPDERRIFAAGLGDRAVYQSTDMGETWDWIGGTMASPGSYPVNDLVLSPNGRTLWAVMSERGIQRIPVQVCGGRTQMVMDTPDPLNKQRLDEYHPTFGHSARLRWLREKLVTLGLGELLSLDSQQEVPFELSNAFAIYYREIFFHIPFLIADTLNRNQRFEDARKWYHHIYNPMAVSGAAGNSDEEPYWRYLPFRGHTLEKLEDIERKNPGEFGIYTDDPFDPHAIAALRLGAYEKAIVMKYIDNLLDWGDQLFAQDSWECIVQAAMLYVMAQDLLGKKPKQGRPTYSPPTVKRYDDEFDKEIDPVDFFHVQDTEYFRVAPNTNFAGYWDRAEDRLFKIRHSMNIKGIVRQLALFQPPIDPRQLIRAMAAGQDIASVASQLAAPVPHYRFTTIIQQAKNVTSTLMQLGSALLSALEKKDAEHLNLLRSTHEKAILNLTTRVKEKQLDDAGKSLESLELSLAGATDRRAHYQNLIDGRLSTEETASQNLMISALAFQTASGTLHLASAPAYLIPNIYGLADGGSDYGKAVQIAATVSEVTAAALNQGSQLAAAKAQNERRKEEWELQEALAGHDVDQISVQILGATIRQEVAQMDQDMHHKSIEQASEREDLLRGKFTNHDLYQWMVGRVSSVYFQTYKIAFDLARAAEKAYQYERDTDEALITFGYWDSLKKGLLAGEGLMLALNQLEKAYMDDNERPMEIEKTISLNQLDVFNGEKAGATIGRLKTDKEGKCTFNLSESLFDQDFPGHYCRKIKSIGITIPALVGPYQNVQATLTQDTNRLLLKPDPKGVAYLISKSKETSAPDSVRSDWRRQQHIAISKGVNDSGLFELNFRDERYLPFEGTGAVSSWTFEMRKKANESILESVSDVIVHLRYTAKDGGDPFRKRVSALAE